MDMPVVMDAPLRSADRPIRAAAVGGPLFDLGGGERRMHVRAYAHWVSLLRGRAFPAIADIDPATAGDFGAHGVLLDFAGDDGDPRIAYLGAALRDECRVDGAIARVAQVPPRSLLARLTDQYRRLLANRAPIGFEAEFVGARGRTTLYRGILMPFAAADGDDIGFVYGVINWKEVADPAVQAELDAELDGALNGPLGAALLAGMAAPHDPSAPAASVWADGPHAGDLAGPMEDMPAGLLAQTLATTLAMAQRTAVAVRLADARRRTVLYRALGRAHDLALAAARDPAAWAALTQAAESPARSRPSPRVSMPAVAALVFGHDYDAAALAEFAAVLDHARRHGVAAGRLAGFVEEMGGIDATVAAERRARRRRG